MRRQGTIIRWEEARGFGFIRSPSSTADVFCHLRDFRAGELRPRQGLAVTFEEIHVGGKGPRAMAIQLAGAGSALPSAARPAQPRRPSGRVQPAANATSGAWLALPLMLAYGAVLVWSVWARHMPAWVLGASFLLNLLAFFAYWQDKYAAEQRKWRISEGTLHLWSLAGGWGGAWFAQQVLRHKSRKPSFREAYWVTVVLNCGAVGALIWSLGRTASAW